MTDRVSETTAAGVAKRIYGVMLRLYPRSYRRRYAQQMIDTFGEAQEAHLLRRSFAGTARFWIREAFGIAGTLPREWWRAVRHRTIVGNLIASRLFGTVAVFIGVLGVYVATLAPTVTFWDAGEFLAASRSLGIPHPPGTPLFTLLSSVWARIVPFGEYAFRVNLLTAVFGAAAAAAVYTIVSKALSHRSDGGFTASVTAAAAAMLSASAFTVWQNANETEVYMIAAFAVMVIAALALRWRHHRGTPKAQWILLGQLYLGALSIGNHLLALLIGPAVVVFMVHVARTNPLPALEDRRHEWSAIALFGSIWVLLIAVGLGNGTLLTLAAMGVLSGTALSFRAGDHRFPMAAAAVTAVGVSTYVFLYIRAGLQPFLNEGDPSTWESLLAVIRREQYPPRLPTDNPLFESGPMNPGRTLQLLWLQTLNYLQYFDWQWAAGVRTDQPAFAVLRLPFTLAFTALGFAGARMLHDRDRSVFWLLVTLFVITGPGLVLYMNFRPGFSIGYDLYPAFADHEVRERDYFFLVSFQVWGMLAGIGILAVYQRIRCWFERPTASAGGGRWALRTIPAVFGLAVVPLIMNAPAADRARGPTAELARDWAYDLLQTVEPYGVLFTGGDNDTFPLWALQAEGFRPDVTVVVLPLSNTDWFIRQLRDKPVESFDPEDAPWYASAAPEAPPPPVHSWSDQEIAALRPMALPSDFRFRAGVIDEVLPRGTPLFIQDLLALRLIQENVGRRPVYLSMSAGTNDLWQRLGDSLVQEGLAFRLYAREHPDSARLAPGVLGPPVDVERTDTLLWDVYRYAGLFDVDTLEVDPTSRNVTRNLSLPYLALAQAYFLEGDDERARLNLARAKHLEPTLPTPPGLSTPPFADSPRVTELIP